MLAFIIKECSIIKLFIFRTYRTFGVEKLAVSDSKLINPAVSIFENFLQQQ